MCIINTLAAVPFSVIEGEKKSKVFSNNKLFTVENKLQIYY